MLQIPVNPDFEANLQPPAYRLARFSSERFRGGVTDRCTKFNVTSVLYWR